MAEHEEAQIAAVTYWYLIVGEIAAIRDSELGGIGHACKLETSLQLAINPELLHMDKAIDSPIVASSKYLLHDMFVPGAVFLHPDFITQVQRQAGHAGSPKSATVDKGERILQAVTAKLADFLREFHAMEL